MLNIEKYCREIVDNCVWRRISKEFGESNAKQLGYALAKAAEEYGNLECLSIANVLDWLQQEAPNPFLTNEEEEILHEKVDDIKDMVCYIVRVYNGEKYWISINVMDIDSIGIPIVNEHEFEHMELGRRYTLEELGLVTTKEEEKNATED